MSVTHYPIPTDPLVPRKSSLFSSQEERIQKLEALFNMHIDPIGNKDTMVIGLGSALYGITTIIIIISWLNYSYAPIRAKNLPLTTVLLISGILWFIGDLPMNGHVLLLGAFSKCEFWNIWIRVLFCFIYTSVISIRCYALDRVFNQNKPTRGWAYYLPPILFIGAYVVYSIVTTAMPSKLIISYVEEFELCTTSEGYVSVTIGLLWLNWVIILAMMYRLRNIQSTFNEFYEFLVICFFGVAAIIKTTVVHYIQPKYPLVLGFRLAETLSDVIITNGVIWLIIARPVIMCVVRRKSFEREWLLRLRTDGLQDMYEANMNLRTEAPMQYSRMDGEMGGNNQFEKDIMGDTESRSSQFFDIDRRGNPYSATTFVTSHLPSRDQFNYNYNTQRHSDGSLDSAIEGNNTSRQQQPGQQLQQKRSSANNRRHLL